MRDPSPATARRSRSGVRAARGRGVPPRPAGLVERARLVVQLDAGAAVPLTLVAAPPGAGKTVAVSEWAAGRPADALAWVTLDAAAARPAALWARIAAALPPRRDAAAPVEGPDDVAANLLAAVEHRRTPLTLVLDDLHDAAGDTVTAVLLRALGHPALRVVVCTRVDPDLPLHRLRLTGQLREVRGADLAFTTGEARQMLARQRVDLTDADLDLLMRRTEGWAAGLRLATLLLADHPEPARAVREFAGDDRAVVAYLVSEVLDHQPAAVRELLIRTSVLERISGPLADAVAGGHDAQAVLEDLVRRNAFVVPVDRRGHWYRCHALLADLLRAQLLQRGTGAWTEQHRRAARFFARAGDVAPALRHAVRGGDWDLVDALMRDHWTALQAAGAGTLLDDALERVPPDALQRHPFTAVAAAARAVERGEDGRAARLAAAAEDAGPGLAGRRRRQLARDAALVRLAAALRCGDADLARRHGTRALVLTADDAPASGAARAMALVATAHAMIADGDPAADARLREAAIAAQRWAMPALVRRADALRAFAHALDGHLREAGHAAERAGDRGGPEAQLARAIVAAETGNVGAAAPALRRAAAAAANGGEAGRLQALEVELVRSRLLRQAGPGERQGMLSALERLTGDWAPPRRYAVLAVAARVRLLAALGRPAEARALAARWPDALGAEIAVAAAEADLAGDAPHTALTRSLAAAEAAGAPPPAAAAALATAAAAAEAAGERTVAVRTAERALELAERDGLRLALADACPRLDPVLRHLLRYGTSHRALIGDVLELAATGATPQTADAPAELPEPLSDRELAVLRYLPTMLTSQEIAGELFVTLNTVKSHLRNVYRKLGVGGRRDAVERARELGLLAPTSLSR